MMRKFGILLILFALVLAFGCAKKQQVKGAPQVEAYDIEADFRKANELINKKKFQDARRLLETVRSRDRQMEYAPLAHLRIADSYIAEKEPEAAIDQYRKFLEIYPEHKYASYAQYQIGLIYYNQIRDHERGQNAAHRSIEEFERLMVLYPRNPYREEVAVYLRRSHLILADHEFMVGKFYFKKKAYSSTVKRVEELLATYPNYEREEEALYVLSVSYLKLGLDASAQKYYDRLLTKYPDGDFADKAEKEFRKASK